MKKRILISVFLVSILLALSFSLVMAKTDKINLEGEIMVVDEATPALTIQTADLDVYTIYFAPDYEFTFTQDDVELMVHVKGELQDGNILASWVKLVDEDDGEDGEDGETGKEESAYCSGKKESAHPAIIILANRFEKEVDELMAYFCDGFGVGQIFLALQTEKITDIPFGEHLERRAEGLGWGIIWKNLDYNGKPKNDAGTPPGQDQDKIPPGQEKDKDHDKLPPGQEKDKDKDKIPPGQAKDKDKDK